MQAKATGTMGRVAGTGLLLVFLTVLISGVSNVVNFYAVQGTNSDAFIAVRNAAVAVMLLPLGFLAVAFRPKGLLPERISPGIAH